MKAVLTRCSQARVTVDDEIVAELPAPGLLVLLGVARGDGEQQVSTMVRKISELRILPEECSVLDLDAPVLLVSQFTLLGSTAKGRRPSWAHAASGPEAQPLFDAVVDGLRTLGLTADTGRFGATMQVHSVNEGPFTVLVET